MFSDSSGLRATAMLYKPNNTPVPKAANEIGSMQPPNTNVFTASTSNIAIKASTSKIAIKTLTLIIYKPKITPSKKYQACVMLPRIRNIINI